MSFVLIVIGALLLLMGYLNQTSGPIWLGTAMILLGFGYLFVKDNVNET